jgi:hypothetical protein
MNPAAPASDDPLRAKARRPRRRKDDDVPINFDPEVQMNFEVSTQRPKTPPSDVVKEAAAENNAKIAYIQKLEQEVIALVSLVATGRKNLRELTQSLADATECADRLEISKLESQKDLSIAKEALEAARSTGADTAQRMSNLSEQNDALAEKLRVLEDAGASSENRCDELSQQLEQADSTRKALESELSDVQAKLQTAITNHTALAAEHSEAFNGIQSELELSTKLLAIRDEDLRKALEDNGVLLQKLSELIEASTSNDRIKEEKISQMQAQLEKAQEAQSVFVRVNTLLEKDLQDLDAQRISDHDSIEYFAQDRATFNARYEKGLNNHATVYGANPERYLLEIEMKHSWPGMWRYHIMSKIAAASHATDQESKRVLAKELHRIQTLEEELAQANERTHQLEGRERLREMTDNRSYNWIQESTANLIKQIEQLELQRDRDREDLDAQRSEDEKAKRDLLSNFEDQLQALKDQHQQKIQDINREHREQTERERSEHESKVSGLLSSNLQPGADSGDMNSKEGAGSEMSQEYILIAFSMSLTSTLIHACSTIQDYNPSAALAWLRYDKAMILDPGDRLSPAPHWRTSKMLKKYTPSDYSGCIVNYDRMLITAETMFDALLPRHGCKLLIIGDSTCGLTSSYEAHRFATKKIPIHVYRVGQSHGEKINNYSTLTGGRIFTDADVEEFFHELKPKKQGC